MVWKRIPTAALVALAALLAVIGLLDPGRAHGELPRQATVASSQKIDHGGQGELSSFRLDAGTTGNIAYCAQGYLISPRQGQTVSRYGNPGIPELDYVLYHGYDGEVITSLSGLSAEKSEHATALAVWLAIGEQRPDILTFHGSSSSFHGNRLYRERWESRSDASVRQAAWDLYQAGLAYKNAGRGGIEEGCAVLWLNGTKGSESGTADFQALVTVAKQVRVTFEKKSAQAELTRGNASYGLAGAVYEVFRAGTDERAASFTTDAEGRAALDLAPGTSYYAIEKTAPRGYRLSKERVTFTTKDAGSSVSMSDAPGTVTLTIGKRDAATKGSAQRGASLKGAEFRITSQSTPGWETTAKTDAEGTALVKGIPLGTINVVETKAPTGYRLDPTVRTYRVGADGLTDAGTVELIPEGDFLEHPIAFDLEIAKFLNSTGESASGLEPAGAGIVFEIVSKTTNEVVGSITTGADGHATTAGLWFGDGARADGIKGALPFDRKGYIVREVAGTAPAGYRPADDWEIAPSQMADGSTLRYVVNNTVITSHLQIVKTDAANGQVIPLAGFTFQVLDRTGKPVTQEDWYPTKVTLSEFTTDASGTVTLPGRLRAGSYRIREIATMAPYVLRTENLPFEIPDSEAHPIAVVKVPNDQATGAAELKKTCEADGKALAGAEYDVVAQDEIVSPDGTLQASSGQIMQHVITDGRGLARVEGLPLGSGEARYVFIETAPPAGHAADATPVPFTLRYQDGKTPVVAAKVEATNAPTTLTLSKEVLGSDHPLPGASFQLWNTADELGLTPERGFAGAAIRLGEERTAGAVTLAPEAQRPWVEVEAKAGASIIARGEGGIEIELGPGSFIDEGAYELHARTAEGDLERGNARFEKDRTYRVAIQEGLLGRSIAVEEGEGGAQPHSLSYDEGRDAWAATNLPTGSYRVAVDGTPCGSIALETGSISYGSIEDGSVQRLPVLLMPGADPLKKTTNQKGILSFSHMNPGSYRLAELKAPAGYLTSDDVHEIVVDAQGRIDGEASQLIELKNDHTKVEISERDITNEEEIEGAELAITDEKGVEVASWVSGTSPHRIDALPAGTYTLTERVSPRTHDLASSVDFTVLPTGEVQTVTLYDEPVSITGEIDKRQEVADPTAKGTKPAMSENRAPVTASPEGLYAYSLDFRSASSTWTDEFTVDDDLAAVSRGLAHLRSITTPQAWQDFDGKLNVWFQTNRPSHGSDSGAANATMEDGHDNPWLAHESTQGSLGDDGRVIDYRGWRLWARDVDTAAGATLEVSDLDLEEGEEVVAVRFEFGRVETGFTTRPDGWERSDLKDAHDDLESIADTHRQTFDDPERGETPFAPAILRMQVTDAYTEGTSLENRGRVRLYRNGGGPDLEDADEDQVTQRPVSTVKRLAQTGILSPQPALMGAVVATVCGAVAIWRRRGSLRPRAPSRCEKPRGRTIRPLRRGETRHGPR